jgi:PAS domain S-box-containing protein
MKFLSDKIVLKLLGLQKINKSIVISDPSQKDCPMVYVSNEFFKHTGYTVKESLGKNCRFLQGPETEENDILQIKLAIKLKKKITIDILNYKKNGEKFWNRLRISPIFDENKNLIYFAGEQNPIPVESVRRHTFNKIID